MQIAVAEVHLSNGNIKGATILYGEGLGRLKNNQSIDIGLDMLNLSQVVEKKLKILQDGGCLEESISPRLIKI